MGLIQVSLVGVWLWWVNGGCCGYDKLWRTFGGLINAFDTCTGGQEMVPIEEHDEVVSQYNLSLIHI